MLNRLSTQIGQTESDNGVLSPAVREYFRAAGIEAGPNLPPPYWGGALLAWAAIQDGILPPVGAVDPISWLGWGAQLASPVAGAVVVMTAGSGMSQMLIGAVTRTTPGRVYVIGAHDGQVQVRAVPLAQIISARRPPGAALSLSLPQPIAEPVAIAAPAAPQMQLPPAQVVPPSPVEPQIIPPTPLPPAVTPEALQRLLEAVQQQFEDQNQRIDAIARTAVAAVKIRD